MEDLEALGIHEIDWALVEAARNQRWLKVKRIIRRGGNPDMRDYTWDCDLSILEMAVVAGDLDMVRWLVEGAKVDLHSANEDGRTALHTAVKNRHWNASSSRNIDIVAYLLSKGANVQAKSKVAGDTPLHSACYQTNDAVICYLTKGTNAIINEKNRSGKTPLSLAVKMNSSATLQEMIEVRGADVLAEAVDGTTPLHNIIMGGKLQLLRWLVKSKRIDVDYTDSRGRSILHIAASSDLKGSNTAVIHWLLNNGFANQVTYTEKNGKTPLHVASSPNAAALLVEQAGADVSARAKGGATPLHSAVCTRYAHEIIRWLVLHGGADVDAQDDYGRTPLHVAIGIEDSKATEWLCRYGGADLAIRDDKGQSPLDVAMLDCDSTMTYWGYKSPILKILQHEVSCRYEQVQLLARKGVFSCHVRRQVVGDLCP